MNPQTFFDHFERLTDAPNAVARLRELVLQLAVQGKLVAQDERDEPAARLLERIEAERRQLVREKKIKEAKPLPLVSDEEKPYNLPSSWKWVKLGVYTLIVMGQSPESETYNKSQTGLPFFQGKSDFGMLHPIPRIWCAAPLKIAQDGDVLISVRAPVGPTNICVERSCIGRGLSALRSLADSDNYYLLYFLRSVEKQIAALGVGSTFAAISKSDLDNVLIAVPPVEEQKRIVAKVDELMRLCDELERAQGERREARRRLNRAALDKLLAAHDAAEFQARWQTVFDHFPTLTAAPDQIGKLRQTVLQLAVQGKLTRQDPQDEPATSLLRRIRAERERLVKEKRLKRADPFPPVNPDKTPFALPSGWTWARLNDILLLMDSGWSPTCKEQPTVNDSSWGVLKTTAVQNMRYDEQAHKELPSDLQPRPEYEVKKGDLLITRAGPKQRVGICCYVDNTRPHLMISDKIIRFHLFEPFMFPAYIALCLNTGYSQQFIESQKSGMAVSQMNISQPKLRQTPIAVPPLEEQKRIVAAVNRLMALCDELEAGLRRAEEDGERLLRAAVRSLLASTSETLAEEPAELVVK